MSHDAFAWAATQGARDYQEDAANVLRIGGHLVAVLADGMGGHAGGAIASSTVCETFLGHVHGDHDGAGSDGYGSDDACMTTDAATLSPAVFSQAALRDGLVAANAAVAARVEEAPGLSGMGSTLIGAVFAPAGLRWISVGDSPLYLIRDRDIAQLNEDHSMAPELDRLAAEGHLTAERARRDPRRHMLRSAVTGDEIDLIDSPADILALEAGDHVLLASDGVQTLEPEEILRVVTAYEADGPDAIAHAVIRAVDAVRELHQDNATVIVVSRRG